LTEQAIEAVLVDALSIIETVDTEIVESRRCILVLCGSNVN
jgi:hypothetical protein